MAPLTRPGAPWFLDPYDPDAPFPDVETALTEPDGLLAVGGDLSTARLLRAYRQGIFPWYSAGQPILWWSPDPRAVFRPGAVRVSRSLRKRLRQGRHRLSMDRDFAAVLDACAAPRRDGEGTWITPEMAAAYLRLHAAGHAHSVEVREGADLVGGLYGVALGRVFFGESMFSRRTDASKVAFVTLAAQLERWGYRLIDGQVQSEHLARLGAFTLPRRAFTAELAQLVDDDGRAGAWVLDADLAH